MGWTLNCSAFWTSAESAWTSAESAVDPYPIFTTCHTPFTLGRFWALTNRWGTIRATGPRVREEGCAGTIPWRIFMDTSASPTDCREKISTRSLLGRTYTLDTLASYTSARSSPLPLVWLSEAASYRPSISQPSTINNFVI